MKLIVDVAVCSFVFLSLQVTALSVHVLMSCRHTATTRTPRTATAAAAAAATTTYVRAFTG